MANAITAVAVDHTGVASWEVVVFRDNSANAFALPGGKIGVHTGMLKVATSADQLAAVLGHEVGHVIARHGAERVSQAMAAQAGLLVTDLLLETNRNRGTIMAALGLGAQFGVILPHGRKQESESDDIGQQLMAMAGFDPRESVQLWRNMQKPQAVDLPSGSPLIPQIVDVLAIWSPICRPPCNSTSRPRLRENSLAVSAPRRIYSWPPA